MENDGSSCSMFKGIRLGRWASSVQSGCESGNTHAAVF